MDLRETVSAKTGLDLGKVLLCFSLFCFTFTGFLSIGFSLAGILTMVQYVQIPVFAAMGSCFCRGAYFRRKIYLLFLLFPVWIVLSFWLQGSVFSDNDQMFTLIKYCGLCGVFLPFAYLSGDGSRRKILDTFLFAAAVIFAVQLWLAFAGLLRGHNICILPGALEFGATYTYTGRMMLKVSELHYYRTGMLSVGCFFSCLYLAVSHRNKRLIPVWTILLLSFAAGILITYSRTAVFAFVGGLLLAFHILLQRIGIRPAARRLIFFFSMIFGAALTIAVMNKIYEQVHSIRDIWYGITTLSSRTDIWKGALEIFSDQPAALLRGISHEQILPALAAKLPEMDTVAHVHSSYLQVLLAAGIPGLFLVLAFCAYLLRCGFDIFFASPGTGIRAEHKCLLLIPLVCMVMGLVELIVFHSHIHTELLNLMMAMSCGYLIEIRHTCKN